MKIDLPEHEIGPWRDTPFFLIMCGYAIRRRLNWRWTLDHYGCRCKAYWEYCDEQ